MQFVFSYMHVLAATLLKIGINVWLAQSLVHFLNQLPQKLNILKR